MKQLLRVSVLLLVFTVFISCKTTKQVQVEQPILLENALLWKIEGKELKKPSYLFGTMHLIDTASFFWPKNTLATIQECEKITLEVDMSMMNDVSKQLEIMEMATMKDDKKLSDLLSAEEYEIIDKFFKKIGLPLFFLERLKPMFLTIFAAGSKDNVSYELKIIDIAKEQNKSISGLETMEYQMSMFDSIPYEEQAKALLESIQTSGDEDGSMNQLISLYRAQNVSKLYTMIHEEMKEESGSQAMLLDTRNKNWIPVMGEMMKTNSHFFAVGAGHLGGPVGVINLLIKKGYRVTPISQ